MSLTIKELEIRMRVGGDDNGAERPSKGPAAAANGCAEIDRKQIVDDSVRRVLQALRNLEER